MKVKLSTSLSLLTRIHHIVALMYISTNFVRCLEWFQGTAHKHFPQAPNINSRHGL